MVASVVLVLHLALVPYSKMDVQTKTILVAAKKLEAWLPITKERVLAQVFIRKGMTEKQVNALLGEPDSVFVSGSAEFPMKSYHRAGITIFYKGDKVLDWD